MGAELDLDDVAAVSELAMRELADLRVRIERQERVMMTQRAVLRRCAEIMRRSDRVEFEEGSPPVTGDEWFRAIERAERLGVEPRGGDGNGTPT